MKFEKNHNPHVTPIMKLASRVNTKYEVSLILFKNDFVPES